MIGHVAGLVALIGFLVFAARRLLTYLHIFQQEEYDGPRFLRWLLHNGAFDRRLSLAIVAIFIAQLVLGASASDWVFPLAIGVLCVAVAGDWVNSYWHFWNISRDTADTSFTITSDLGAFYFVVTDPALSAHGVTFGYFPQSPTSVPPIEKQYGATVQRWLPIRILRGRLVLATDRDVIIPIGSSSPSSPSPRPSGSSAS